MKEQAYNKDRDQDHKSLKTKAISFDLMKECHNELTSREIVSLKILIKAKGERKSLALKAKKESSDEECSTFKSENEEYTMAVRDFKKFLKRRGRFVRQPQNDKKTLQRSRDDKNGKSDRKYFRFGDPNHLIGERLKPPKDKNQRAFVGGSWSDSGEEDDEKVKDETCLVAQASNKNEKLKEEAIRLTKFEKSTHCLNKMLSNQKPSRDKLGIGFNSFEASSSGTKEIKFVRAQKKASSDRGPINIGGPQNVQAAPKVIKGPPLVGTPGSEKSVSFQKSILGPRPKHIIVNNVKVPVASDNEVKQFYKPLSKPIVGFSKPNFRSKTPPPRRVNNNYSRAKMPQPKRNVGRQNQPHGFPVTWNNFPRQSYMPWEIYALESTWNPKQSLLITNQDNNQVKNNKIDLLVQQYEQFTILEEESSDSGFARFNTIITSLKDRDEGFCSKNYVWKFLRALHPKWRAKVTVIKESKDLSSLALDELIGNLKVHKVVMEKDSKIYKGKKERVKSITLKAQEKRVIGKFFRQPREEKKSFRQRDDKKIKSDRKYFTCGDPNLLIGKCPKPSRNKDQKAFVGGCWSDSENEADDKINDETCLMSQSSNEVTLDSSHYSDNASSLDDDSMKLNMITYVKLA
ncbi:hypothetical protein Tco_0332746 [Tanacetum coccineum]